jgi:hypothetical protein
MLNSNNIYFWVSGFALGLAICAFFSCPLWKFVVPIMLFLSVFAGITGFKKNKELKDS